MVIPTSSVAKADSTVYKSKKGKHVYSFDEGNRDMRELLGGKGANLAEMTNIGVPVPFGFVITTEVCDHFLTQGAYPNHFAQQLEEKLNLLEARMEKKFGDDKNPLLVSVRSGAAKSMPGMMDTILNLGMNDKTAAALIVQTNNERFVYDSYRRFVQMFGNVVMGVSSEHFEDAIESMKSVAGVELDTQLGADDLKRLVLSFKEIVIKHTDQPFPESPYEQLKLAIEAVFTSWDNDRAKTYRRINNITGLKGTAVTVQSMVFGNMGDDCGTGVAFTRNPSNGDKAFYGEFLMNAQGEDVVAGTRTPMNISELEKVDSSAYKELIEVKTLLEKHYKDMQDIEFTIEKGKLYLLQTRSGKRTIHAAIKMACDMVDEKLVTKSEALLNIDANQLDHLLHPHLKKGAKRDVVAKGLPASPGAASGKVVFTADDALEWSTEKGEKVILVRKETSPEDIHGMHVAEGILTARGGMTSHAAVVCRGMGKCCVAGCSEIMVNSSTKKLIIGDLVLNEGDVVTLDGNTGEVILGEMEMQEPELNDDFRKIMSWTDEVRTMKVRTNADTPEDVQVALDFGAEGVGLCRTEHMFFDEERITYVRHLILSSSTDDRMKPLKKLKEYQKKDFEGIFEVLDGLPITVRLLDPPLHEFLPEKKDQIKSLAEDMKMTVGDLNNVIGSLHEVNPMMGHRGCRLGITFPEIYQMQVQAICEAGIAVVKNGKKVNVEIEIPLIGSVTELAYLRTIVQEVVDSYGKEVTFDYKIGTMVETPRACVTADEIALEADFLSFGTNDLTQLTYGFSRDDSGKFLSDYIDKGILERDPTASIDTKGVGGLMDVCINLARKAKPDLEIGICGEHGGEPDSVKFCHKIKLDYVSCSPYRIPIAKLAAAQAAIEGK